MHESSYTPHVRRYFLAPVSHTAVPVEPDWNSREPDRGTGGPGLGNVVLHGGGWGQYVRHDVGGGAGCKT